MRTPFLNAWAVLVAVLMLLAFDLSTQAWQDYIIFFSGAVGIAVSLIHNEQ